MDCLPVDRLGAVELGDFDQDGRQLGRSRIERITDGRVVFENWTGDSGGVGTSMDFYDVFSA